MEKRKRRRTLQQNFLLEMKRDATNSNAQWLTNSKRQKYLGNYLNDEHNDSRTMQLYCSILDLKTTSSRNMIQMRVPKLYEKYLSKLTRKLLPFSIGDDVTIQKMDEMFMTLKSGGGVGGGGGGKQKQLSKNMFHFVTVAIATYIQEEIMEGFKKR